MGDWYDTHEAAEGAARRYEQERPRTKVQIVGEDGDVVPRLD